MSSITTKTGCRIVFRRDGNDFYLRFEMVDEHDLREAEVKLTMDESDELARMLALDPSPEQEVATPTPIDPADIRPGDVVERRRLYVMKGRGPDHGIDARCHDTNTHEILNPAVGTWHLVHRPDPDAEAVEALNAAGVADAWPPVEHDRRKACAAVLMSLREQGFDVTKRAET